MDFNVGEFFIVERGAEIDLSNNPIMKILTGNISGEEWKSDNKSITYDKSYEGLIFEVAAFEPTVNLVVGKCVYDNYDGRRFQDFRGKVLQFNQKDVSLMTISKSYVDAAVKVKYGDK